MQTTTIMKKKQSQRFCCKQCCCPNPPQHRKCQPSLRPNNNETYNNNTNYRLPMPECSLAETIQGLDRLRSGAAGLMVGSLSDVVPLSIESMYVAVSTNTCLHAGMNSGDLPEDNHDRSTQQCITSAGACACEARPPAASCSYAAGRVGSSG